MPGPVKPIRDTTVTPNWTLQLEDHVIGASWSPTGAHLVAAAVSGPIALVDVATGERALTWAGHGFGTTAVTWHPRQNLIASAGQDGKVKFWSPASAVATHSLPGGAAWVEHVAWSPDGTYLASAAGKILRLWNPLGEQVREYPKHGSTIADITWTHEKSARLASVSYGMVQLFRVGQTEPTQQLKWRGASILAACSPDARYLATGDQDCTVHIWRPERAAQDPEDEGSMMQGFPTKIRSLSWSYNSKYLALTGGSSVCIWDCAGKGPEGRRPLLCDSPSEAIFTHVAFQRAGLLLASGDEDGQVALWHPQQGETPVATFELGEAVSQLAWSPNDGQLLVGGDQGKLTLLKVT